MANREARRKAIADAVRIVRNDKTGFISRAKKTEAVKRRGK